MPNYYVPSQDELPKGEDRAVLPGNEDYVLKVLEINEQSKPDFNGKIQDVFVVKMEVLSFADGVALEDTEGSPVEGTPWVWKDIDPARMGFKTDGTPSIARQFFCAANGIADATERVPEGDTADLIGRTLIGTLVVYKKKDNSFANKLTTFKTPSRRRGAASAAPARQTQPAGPLPNMDEPDDIDPAYLAAVANLVNDTDTPTTEDLSRVEATLSTGRKGRKKATDDDLGDLPF